MVLMMKVDYLIRMEIKFPGRLMKQLMSLINETNTSFNSIAITY
jgi:hypothetical protein